MWRFSGLMKKYFLACFQKNCKHVKKACCGKYVIDPDLTKSYILPTSM